jgi:outer membrane protein
MLSLHLRVASFGLAAICLTSQARAQEAQQGAPASAPALQRKPLSQCVAIALTHNIEVRSAAESTALAEAQRSEVRGQFGPKLGVDATYQHWNTPYVFGGFPVHDLNVWNVTATITQPITALFAIYDAYKVRDLGVDIAAVRSEAVRRQTAFRVVEAYYKLLQAERLAEVASASIDQLSAQLRRSQSFHEHGTVSADDVLRAQLALANAQQRSIAAQARVTLERTHLCLLMGLSPDTPLEVEPVASDRPITRDVASLAQAEQAAEGGRVELREVDKQIAQSGYDERFAYAKLAPQISVVGSYIHNEGSLFSQTNAGYVGAVASWNLWDWGTTLSGISEAKARARQAVLARAKIGDQIKLEVTQAFLGVNTASEAMDVAKAAVAAAEENYRLVTKRYEAAVATSFDVIDAEGLLTQARGLTQTAFYDFLIAQAALHAAMGASPEALARE